MHPRLRSSVSTAALMACALACGGPQPTPGPAVGALVPLLSCDASASDDAARVAWVLERRGIRYESECAADRCAIRVDELRLDEAYMEAENLIRAEHLPLSLTDRP